MNINNNINTISKINSNPYSKINNIPKKSVVKDTVEISITKEDVIKNKIQDGYYETSEFNKLLIDKLIEEFNDSIIK